MTPDYAVGFCLALLFANLGVLALSMKLYTEIMKDKNQDRRSS